MADAFQACVRAPFATLGISATEKFVTGVRFLAPSVPAKAPPKDTIAYLACIQLQAYLEDGAYVFDVPYRLSGSHHRMLVWEAMCRIPAGKVRSYGDLAAEIGSSARAVGGACGANPVPVIVPCHRIIGANNTLGGFMGAGSDGFEHGIKRWLLKHEGVI